MSRAKILALAFAAFACSLLFAHSPRVSAQTSAPLASPTPQLHANGKIAFARKRTDNGKYAVFTINPDGTGLAQLTSNDVNDDSPAWSPDGKRSPL